MAYSFDAKDDFKEKMLESEKMWKKDMSQAQLLKEEGNAFFKVGKIPDALAKYEAGIKALKPDETALKAQLWNNVAHCNVQLYDPKKVITACDEVIALEPFNTKALLRRATAYESTEKIRAALNDFEKVILVDPKSDLAQKGASRMRAQLRQQGKDL
jgi:tetratricopeptide (TPR) repeat protein